MLNAKLKPPIQVEKYMSDKVSMLSLFFPPRGQHRNRWKIFPSISEVSA